MGVKFSNNGHSTLASSLTSSGTSITVASGHGARFPSLSSGEYFYATLIDASNNLEIVKVTARSSDVLTATRAQESTTARAFAIGDRIELRVTAQGLVDLRTIAADEIVNSMIATDAVNSDSIAANAVTASELNISGNGTAGQAVLSDGDGSFSYGTGGGLIKVTHMQSTTRNSLSATSGATLYDFSFTKDKAYADSYLILTGQGTIYTTYSDYVGLYAVITSNNNSGTNDSSAFHGATYNDNAEQSSIQFLKKFDDSSLTAGSHTLRIGYRPRNGQSSVRPGNVWNPNSSDDARMHQKSLELFLWEIAK